MRRYYVSVPKNFDPAAILADEEVTHRINRQREKLYYVVGEVSRKTFTSLQLQWYGDDELTAPTLNATDLKQTIGNRYRAFVDLLQTNGVIRQGTSYRAGEVSKTYQLELPYMIQPLRRVELTDHTLKLALHKRAKRRKQKKTTYGTTARSKATASTPMVFDLESGLQWIDRYHQILLDKISKGIRAAKERNKLREQIQVIVNSYIFRCYGLHQGTWEASTDQFGFREYNPATNLKEELRRFLTYQGEPLWSLDIRNSQPYFAVPILDQFRCSGMDHREKDRLLRWIQSGENGKDYKEKKTRRKVQKETYKSTMFPVCSETLYGSGFQHNHEINESEFARAILQGTVYEDMIGWFGGKVTKHGRDPLCDRDAAKTELLHIMYHDPKYRSLKYQPKNGRRVTTIDLFAEKFPYEFEQLQHWKQKDYRDFPRLLQRIESYTVLCRIAARIRKEYPEAPVITIHDSVMTTGAFKDAVQKIMMEECTLVTGHAPNVKVELLLPKGAWDKLDELEATCAKEVIRKTQDRIRKNKAQTRRRYQNRKRTA